MSFGERRAIALEMKRRGYQRYRGLASDLVTVLAMLSGQELDLQEDQYGRRWYRLLSNKAA